MRGRVSGKDKKFQSNVTLEFLADFQFLESAVVRLSDQPCRYYFTGDLAHLRLNR
jgi:hypothetical protein